MKARAWCIIARLLPAPPHSSGGRSSLERTLMGAIEKPVLGRIADLHAFHDELTAIRHDIHAHPETAFEEKRTSDLVARKLAEWGFEVHRGLAKTGVVGVIRSGDSK